MTQTDPEIADALEAYAASYGKELRNHFRRDAAEMKAIIADWVAQNPSTPAAVLTEWSHPKCVPVRASLNSYVASLP